ncbi:MAG TPA: hypothetical protein VM364_23155 [Vicinamibacterales bacterium]|nr:hypothetical protein [Vicinamibacterales bacterium]
MSRYLTIAARRPALIAAVAAHAALGAAFVASWGGTTRLPGFPGATLYEQLLRIDALFLAVAAPWVAARLIGGERREDVDRLSLQYGRSASAVHRARIGAAFAWTVTLQAAVLPAALEVQQLSGTALATAAGGQAALLALCLVAVTLVAAAAARTDCPLTRWLGPAALLVVAVAGLS